MKRAVWIFLLAVLVPVLALAALALRAAQHEKVFLENQLEESARLQAALVVSEAETELNDLRQEFAAIYREVNFTSADNAALQKAFHEFQKLHPFARLIFLLDADGTILLTAAPDSEFSIAGSNSENREEPKRTDTPLASVENERGFAATGTGADDRGRLKRFDDANAAPPVVSGNIETRAALETPPSTAEPLLKTAEQRRQQLQVSEMTQVGDARDGLQNPAPQPPSSTPQKDAKTQAGALRFSGDLQQQTDRLSGAKLEQQGQQAQQQQMQQSQQSRKELQDLFWDAKSITGYRRAETNVKKIAAPPKQDAAADSVKIGDKPVEAIKDGDELHKGETAAEHDTAAVNRSVAKPATAPAEADGGRAGQRESSLVSSLPADSKLKPQLSNFAAFNAPVVSAPARFREFLDLGRPFIPRVTNNALSLLLWARDPSVSNRIAVCEIDLTALKTRLQRRLGARSWPGGMCAAVLDDKLLPVALSAETFAADWRRPLVAEPLSEALPHWTAAVYSSQPQQLAAAAQWVSWTVALAVSTCLIAIFVGTLLVWRETARERRLTQQKADFVTNVTHELQTPLANIRLFSEMLGRTASATEKQRQYAGVLVAETERLSRLINNVLEFARTDRRRAYQMQVLNPAALVEEVMEQQRPRLEAGGFKLHLEMDVDVPMVKGDREALTQVLLNLISNAEKYCGEKKEMDVVARRADENVEIAVLDRGIGVPNDEREKIFEPFYRVNDQLNSGASGTGLGLTLARRIARDHGGDLRCETRTGGGSVFVLSLPIVKE